VSEEELVRTRHYFISILVRTLSFIRPTHKPTCGPEVKGSGILKLAQNFFSNKLISLFLQICLILDFDLLRNRSTNRPLMARLDVGIEPSDITLFLQLLYGADIGTNVEGIFQINAVSPDGSGRPLSANHMEIWRDARNQITAQGFASDPVVIVELVKDSKNSIHLPLHIQEAAFIVARRAEPFVNVSALTGVKTEKPMSAMACIE
jgi:hypothetical protein